MSSYALATIHRSDWHQVRAMLPTQHTWFWCDLDADGAHVAGAPPVTPPFCTHLWGWATDSWIRLRIDEGEAFGAHLTRSSDPTCAHAVAEPTVLSAQGWQPNDWRVQLVERLRAGSIRLLQVGDTEPLTFVERVG